MLIYWLMFGFPSTMAFVEQSASRGRGRFGYAWLFACLSLIVLIGFRWQTGGDWGNYDRMVEQALWNPLELSPLNDPGFTLLTHFAASTSLGLLVVTAISGLVMGIALTRFCLSQPRPWLCMAVAIPYLVVVMGMGYIRQGMAISFLLMGLVSLRQGHVLRYCAWICVGALFHSTVLVFLPLGAMVGHRIPAPFRLVMVLAALLVVAKAILEAHAANYVTNYFDAEMTSSGAAIRLLMTALPAAIFLAFRSRFALADTERDVWTALSLASLAALALLLVSRSSTVVDRLGLYLIPVQCFVYARVPAVFARRENDEKLLIAAIIVLYALSFFVWLNFADNVNYWLPYRSFFFQDNLCLRC